MELTHFKQNNIYVVTLTGSLTNTTADVCNKYLDPVLKEMKNSKTANGLILDLKGVDILDSSGIGLICGKFVRLKKQGKKMALCSLNETVRQAFVLTDLDKTIPVYSTTIEGINRLGV